MNTTPAAPAELDAYLASPAVVDFLRDLRAADDTASVGEGPGHTEVAYGRHLAAWLAWLQVRTIQPMHATETDVAGWLADLQAVGAEAMLRVIYGDTGRKQRPHPDKSSTVRARLAAVASWYAWLTDHEMATGNPAAAIAGRPGRGRRPADQVLPPASDSRPTEVLTTAQVRALLADADRHSPLAAALIWLYVFADARVGEPIAAKISDLGVDDGRRVLRVNRKGSGRIGLPIIAEVDQRLDRYIATRHDIDEFTADPTRPAPLLFLTERGNQLSTTFVRRLLESLAKEAGLPTLHPQMLTATAAADRRRHGSDLLRLVYLTNPEFDADTMLR